MGAMHVLESVPPRPLHDPTTSTAFTEALLTSLAGECDVDVDVKAFLCRDQEEVIPRRLPAECIAVIARRRPWGSGSARRWIGALRRYATHVIVVDAGGSKPASVPVYAHRMTL